MAGLARRLGTPSMEALAQPFYLAAARLAAALRHPFLNSIKGTWRLQIPKALFPIELATDDGGIWRAFALRELHPLHALLIDHVTGLREIRHSLRECAFCIRDSNVSGPAVEVSRELLGDIFASRWLANLSADPEHSGGEGESRIWVEFSVLAPNAHLADQMATAARTLLCHPSRQEVANSTFQSSILSGVGAVQDPDPVELYTLQLKHNKANGVPKPAQQARKAVEERTGKKYARNSLRVLAARRRSQKGDKEEPHSA